MTGKKHTKQSNLKNRLSHIGRPLVANYVRVRQLDKNTNKLIKIWPSLKQAAIFLKIHKGQTQNITKACKNQIPSTYGFKWSYC